ncbi:MAG TPA: DUF1015 domain-containing protein [Nocardioides sp.]|uniref:DUF1015 domain-containing protein n=1 Tax=Nocardioides sp. TaxID=35761 RepID=UPI002D7EB452|nr:DUF1015 domain-containing protein [Nocardioides sp.]HET6654153.1 DUF1015 domain-containing protein [Nocardioides sp.]
MPQPHAPGRRPFTLAPFRGLRFDPETVGDLSTVISPPYDVLDADTVRTLENANRRNIVRLILSRRFERPYLAVRDRLEKWRQKGYLRADEDPALYVYEYTAEQITVRGLIGLVGLRDEFEKVILPHEDVMPAPVDDRAVLMRTTETNLEPILLVHEGTAGLRGQIAEAARRQPLADAVALDGSSHRLWAVTDPASQAAIAAELADTEALIADGHHRYAAYLRLRDELRGAGTPEGTSPWDHGLAMLVDQHDQALRVGPIHRSVAALTMRDLQDLADDRGDDLSPQPDREAAFAAQDHDRDDRATFVVSDGQAWAVLSVKRTHDVDAAVLHETLLPAWHIAEEQVGYHHSLDQALHATTRAAGLVVAVRPPSVQEVRASAARGVRMPRKSTSFGPKPRMGVVMRDLRDA